MRSILDRFAKKREEVPEAKPSVKQMQTPQNEMKSSLLFGLKPLSTLEQKPIEQKLCQIEKEQYNLAVSLKKEAIELNSKMETISQQVERKENFDHNVDIQMEVSEKHTKPLCSKPKSESPHNTPSKLVMKNISSDSSSISKKDVEYPDNNFPAKFNFPQDSPIESLNENMSTPIENKSEAKETPNNFIQEQEKSVLNSEDKIVKEYPMLDVIKKNSVESFDEEELDEKLLKKGEKHINFKKTSKMNFVRQNFHKNYFQRAGRVRKPNKFQARKFAIEQAQKEAIPKYEGFGERGLEGIPSETSAKASLVVFSAAYSKGDPKYIAPHKFLKDKTTVKL